jgi:hypothetical protein
MLKFLIALKNPYAKDVYCKSMEYDRKITKNKHIEFEHYYSNYYLFFLNIDTSWRGEDHAGPEVELCIFGFSFRYKIYDTRHWDYKIGNWTKAK